MSAPGSGQLRVVGLGPGRADWLTPEASAALGSAEHILGYQTYLARLPPLQRATLHPSDNGDEIARAFEILREERSAKTVVALGRAVGRSSEQLHITTLGAITTASIDMQTLVLVGSSATRAIERSAGLPWIYTPRSASEPA
jgi:precorrin-3B methylase